MLNTWYCMPRCYIFFFEKALWHVETAMFYALSSFAYFAKVWDEIT